jgi:hypothetical protein
MEKNQLGFVNKYIAPAIRTAATILAGQAIMPSISEAVGLPSDLFGTTQTMPSGFDALEVYDATQLAAQGLNPGQISQILTQQYALSPQVAAQIAQAGFDNAFSALDASRLAEITTDPNAIQQNLIASGIDPSIAADLAQQAAMGGTVESMAADLANFYSGSPVYTNAGLLEGGRTLDQFGREIANISSTSVPGLGNSLQNVGRIVSSLTNQPTVQQQAGLSSGGGATRGQGVDYSSLLEMLQGKAGLLPTAEPYRRGLL